MILHRFRRLIGAAILALAPSLAFAQSPLQQPCFDTSKCRPADNIGAAVGKLYANDLFLLNTVTSPLPQVVALQGQVASLQATVSASSGATAGTYGSASLIPVVTVDARGRVTGISTIAPGQPSIAAGTILANLTGASATPVGSTLSAILDSQIGSARATIAVRGASTWGAYTPVTSGCTFQFNGTDTVCASASPGTGAVRYDASQGLTSGQQAQGRSNIAAAASGANSDITALSGLTTLLSVAQGGTGGGTAAAARSGIGSAASGANADITSLVGLTTPLSQAQGGTGATAAPPLGQVRLTYSSASALSVKPYNGNQITVNGAPQTVPSAGVSCSNTGLTAATLYYAYVYLNGSTLTCEMVTTAHATGTNGVEIKSGDATRTLVGMAYMASGTPGTFADNATFRGVASWFNRQSKTLENSVSGVSSASTSMADLGLVVRFVTWADEPIQQNAVGLMTVNAAGNYVQAQCMIDGVAVGGTAAAATYQPSTASYFGPLGLSRSSLLSEVAHSATVAGSVNGGTGSWSLSQTVTVRQ